MFYLICTGISAPVSKSGIRIEGICSSSGNKNAKKAMEKMVMEINRIQLFL
jgi:hypothetical protein